ncbi:MAG TPA: adenylate/guanylate cyclase domain-containing protein [Acidimicrobiia bacterium]|jgi:pimeloyl-ACP methyl ester carboxylesterase|nr:adenylate/guanylate cyclase domain-containing protein [Acidimicrobiia bacterium]
MGREPPQTRYAKKGGLHIAYQVVGDGPLDLVLISEWHLPLDARWQEGTLAGALSRLAGFSRLISFDKRGIGCSDPVPLGAVSAIEDWMDDLVVVLDTVGSSRAALFAVNESGAVGVLFAASYPDRTAALILANTIPRWLRADDYPWGIPADAQNRLVASVAEHWLTGADMEKLCPTLAREPRARTRWLNGRRLQASPATAQAIYRTLGATDVRHILPAIRVPTLILQRTACYAARVEHGRYMAENIPGAKYIELPGEDLFWWVGDADAVVDEVEEFVTGVRPTPKSDRVLATVLFTDIVGSTERASELGDRRWRALLDEHDTLVRRELERYRGREVKVVGDEFLATFDGPARAIHCACAIAEAVRGLGLEIRAGLHTGEVELRG